MCWITCLACPRAPRATCLTCLLALRAHLLCVPTCLRPFASYVPSFFYMRYVPTFFYMPYVPTVFYVPYVPSFFKCLARVFIFLFAYVPSFFYLLSFFLLVLRALIFLPVFRAFISLRVALCALLFYMSYVSSHYVPSFFYLCYMPSIFMSLSCFHPPTCLTCIPSCLHIFTCLRDLIFLRAFISCRFFCVLMFLRALLAFIFHVPWVSQFFYVFYMPAFFYVPFGPSFFTCLTCLFFLLKFWRALSVFTFFYKIWNNPEPTATSRISRNECGFFSKSLYI